MADPARALHPDPRATRCGEVWADAVPANDPPRVAELLVELREVTRGLQRVVEEGLSLRVGDHQGRALTRLLVSPDAILPLHVAAELLPLKDSEALAWLEQNRLVRCLYRHIAGRKVVAWGKVAELLYTEDDLQPGPSRGRGLRRSRCFD